MVVVCKADVELVDFVGELKTLDGALVVKSANRWLLLAVCCGVGEGVVELHDVENDLIRPLFASQARLELTPLLLFGSLLFGDEFS